MKENTIQPIHKRIVVGTSRERAFEVFTQQMSAWWPRTHHIGKTPMTGMILEGKPKGRWYTTHEDRTECDTGHVLVWEPPQRVILAWQLDGAYNFVPSLISELEITFRSEGAHQTVVELEHRNLERLGKAEKALKDMNDGWGKILDLYAGVAQESVGIGR